MDFDTIADELYGVPLAEFTTTRNERAKQARADGDRPLAQQVQSIRKPTQAAWLLNQLVRSHSEETQLLLDLGRELREVLADVEGDELRALTRQRYQLVSALVEQTRALGLARGNRVTDDVAQAVRRTLEATLADEASAEALSAGRLTEPLEIPSGFSVDSSSAAERPRQVKPPNASQGTVTDLDAERKRRARHAAEKQVAAAARRQEQARLSVDRARKHLESVRERTRRAAEDVDRLRDELRAAEAALSTSERQKEEAEQAAEGAQQTAHEAEEELAVARRQLDELDS
jgi:hypothetical protein